MYNIKIFLTFQSIINSECMDFYLVHMKGFNWLVFWSNNVKISFGKLINFYYFSHIFCDSKKQYFIILLEKIA